jgi:hypothetical protein
MNKKANRCNTIRKEEWAGFGSRRLGKEFRSGRDVVPSIAAGHGPFSRDSSWKDFFDFIT